jgi:6,7-dimethyl-8-ribityllumazine synthase
VRVALVVSRFNDRVTSRLLAGAETCLARHGGDPEDRTVVYVPGAWELQATVKRLAHSGKHDAVVALGALIRGETAHFEVLARQVASGLGQVSLDSPVPVIFGVLTTDSLEQAMVRAGEESQNKGWEAASAAIEMVGIFRRLG